jgi:hypothetical protein
MKTRYAGVSGDRVERSRAKLRTEANGVALDRRLVMHKPALTDGGANAREADCVDISLR